MRYILKVYMNPRGVKRGFEIFTDLNWDNEVKSERALTALNGCSSMSRHETRAEAIDYARKQLPADLFNKCF